MSNSLREIVICLGSSCFARGNKKTLGIIQEYLKQNKLEDTVDFRGNHCFGNCQGGPIIKINGNVYERVGEKEIIDILDKEFSINKK